MKDDTLVIEALKSKDRGIYFCEKHKNETPNYDIQPIDAYLVDILRADPKLVYVNSFDMEQNKLIPNVTAKLNTMIDPKADPFLQ